MSSINVFLLEAFKGNILLIIVVLFALAIWAAIRAATWIAKVNEKGESISTFMGEIRDQIKEIRDEISNETKEIRDEIRNETNAIRSEIRNETNAIRAEIKNETNAIRSEIKNEVKEIRADIKSIFSRLPPPETTESDSPRRLSELGERVAEEIQINEWISGYAEALKEQISGKDKNAYEIQEMCFAYAQENLLDDLTEKIPREAMQMSAYNNGIALKQVLDVVGVVLRDEVLKSQGIMDISAEQTRRSA